MSQTRVLVVEDDEGLREALVDTLALAGYQWIEAESAEHALVLLKSESVDIVISDVQMAGMDGLALLRSIKLQWPKMPVLLMTAYANIEDAVAAMKDGAIDYMAKPFAPQVLLNMVGRYAPIRPNPTNTVAADPKSLHLLAMAEKVAKTDASVMVLGPSGSGKEVLSRYIHEHSSRSNGPFVAINCAAIPENMLEAMLFGYEKGAFTGAVQACPGKFEQAQAGTILLDEISEMDVNLQAKLLRVLQEREVERLGGRKSIKLDVRIIATSNRDLKNHVADGLFREDLYYRLNVFPITWPALTERKGDIVPLAQLFLQRHASQQGVAIPVIAQCALNKLLQYTWPGNVRELDNVIQRALIIHDNLMITEQHILIEGLDWLQMTNMAVASKTAVVDTSTMAAVASSTTDSLGNELRGQEFNIILDTLVTCQGNRKNMADRLGISPRTLRYKLAKMRDAGIELPA
ncbi:sigma-54-dependent Fis family transcriptional regulator [Photobacterium carnosum]|uniref:sigma-54-dependent transcriptional regulator n=1 Tax=Photobacterium carnosum TaxID=2023717 RepID=UPI001C9076DC|nr:sigma-54 dependent transcriptional regulator [Photobacterium carnosum]MBY3787268.1 sigma-54-dependent Fis family transcriptional regulator [Photobacterium carnosum]MCD9532525.1 response regulator [Photobacterium carnosum]